MDADGYLYIRGRMKRFAKVSGEMVSLTAVEDALAGAFPQYGLRCQVAVITRPDEDKGEELIAVTNEPKLQLDEIRAAINAKGLSNLCAPREIKVVQGDSQARHRQDQPPRAHPPVQRARVSAGCIALIGVKVLMTLASNLC